jgi:hypothetical protein
MTQQSSAQPSADPATAGGAASLQPPIEARLVQAGKLSMGQLAQAHRDRLETGEPLLEIIVDRGWVTKEEIAELTGEPVAAPSTPPAPAAAAPAPPAPAPQPDAKREPEPSPEPAPAPAEASSEPTAAVVTSAAPPPPKPADNEILVGIRLTTGDLVPAGHATDPDMAATLGQAVVAELTQAGDDEWPFFDGRFIKPDTIVSVDLVVED